MKNIERKLISDNYRQIAQSLRDIKKTRYKTESQFKKEYIAVFLFQRKYRKHAIQSGGETKLSRTRFACYQVKYDYAYCCCQEVLL